MRINIMLLQIRILIIFCVLHCFSINLLAGENSIGKDTLVYKPWRDTVRLTKAQVYDLNSSESLLFYKPRPFEFVKHVPSDLGMFAKAVVAKKNLPALGLLIGSTAILVAFDQPLLDAAQQFGRFIHLDPEHKFKRVISFNIGNFAVPVLDVPQNLNSALYFIGEGWPSILVAGGMYGYGIFKNDYRARQTSSQLAEMFLTLGITTQVLKRMVGRQSPFTSTKSGGEWHPFTNLATYQANVSNYDALPSGHLATIMATITILAGNYPSNKYIKPVGYSLMGLLGYAMMNNSVHWAGDYPIAIAIGYTFGKIALSRGQKTIHKKSMLTGYKSSLMPLFFGQNGYGLSYRLIF
ncbi:MAG: phosphatase PAP2 family protein [Bacteroidia bacterium]|nr:phosphatase PAP2 family protein [Bacteroidia bacterium]